MIRSGKVRRAKLYYLRDRTGKSARIAEKIRKKIGIDIDVKPETVTEENVAPVVKESTSDEKDEAPISDKIKKEEILKSDDKMDVSVVENKTEKKLEKLKEKK